jgi:hypothetical protein
MLCGAGTILQEEDEQPGCRRTLGALLAKLVLMQLVQQVTIRHLVIQLRFEIVVYLLGSLY